jgi:hypothetical protein
MISPATGEVVFSDGLGFGPLELYSVLNQVDICSMPFPLVSGWTKRVMGVHPSNHGEFDVEIVCDGDDRVQTVAVSHVHSFYQSDTPEDSERRAFHVGIINFDLLGQREFSWGEVLSCLDIERNKDWLVVVYTTEIAVPLSRAELLRCLYEHQPEPQDNSASE